MALDGHHQLRDVADLLGVSPPAATKNVDKLERLGLVVRMPSTGDRRATRLDISPAGRQLVQRFDEVKVSRLAPLIANLDGQDVERLCIQLERFALSLLLRHRSREGGCLRCSAHFEPGCPVGRARGGCPYVRIRDARATQREEQVSQSGHLPVGNGRPVAQRLDDDRDTGNVR